MMNQTKPGRIAAIAVLFVLGTAAISQSATVQDPVRIGTSSAQNPTLGIPRWKGWVNADQPNLVWVSYANSSSSGNNMVYSRDGGVTWSDETINMATNGYLDYHTSLFGKNGDLFFTFPGNEGVKVRRFTYPATSNDDRLPLVTMPSTTPYHRSNLMVDGNGRIWVFTRRGDSPDQNVRYNYSDDDGQTWTQGTAIATGTPDIRIGSMPYVDGRACLVVLHLNNSKGYEYYLWNGSSFVAQADHSIHAGNVGYNRAFTHNTIAGQSFHLVFAYAGQLHHYWKDFNGGSGEWNHQILDSHNTMDDMSWAPILTTRGDEMYLFFCRWGTTEASSQIYARRWTRSSGQWEAPALISTGGTSYNRHPNTCFRVPESSGYVPVFWMSGAGGSEIQFNRITGTSVPNLDITPPARVRDLEAVSRPQLAEVQISWTAPGDDEQTGLALGYDIRYAEQPITDGNWHDAVAVRDVPRPAPAGVRQTMTVRGLEPGATYHFAVSSRDEAGNTSDLSNVAWAQVGTGANSSQVPSGQALLKPNYPNPFNPQTMIPFSLPRDGQVSLVIYDGAGRLVAEILREHLPAGTHEVPWYGRDRTGRGVASGTYYCRLTSATAVVTMPLTLIR